GDHSMRGRLRREKSSTFRVVNARCVWRMLHCINPSPPGLPQQPQRKMARTIGISTWSRIVLLRLHPSALTDPFYEGNTGRTGNLEHTEPHPAENAGLSKQGSSPCMIAERSYYSRWACNGFRRSQSNAAHVIPTRG